MRLTERTVITYTRVNLAMKFDHHSGSCNFLFFPFLAVTYVALSDSMVMTLRKFILQKNLTVEPNPFFTFLPITSDDNLEDMDFVVNVSLI
jgi:hypothetical protein